MKKISNLVGKYMAWIVLIIAALALFLPGTCLWIQTKWINYLLMIVMFGLGLLINKLFEKFTRKIVDIMPTVSVTAICLIVAAVVSHNSEKIMSVGVIILIIVILHNLLGYLCGYLIGILFKMDPSRKKAVSIEIGMQNSGLATSLASSAFPDMPMATVPGAIFSVWHNISGAILAGIYRKMGNQETNH